MFVFVTALDGLQGSNDSFFGELLPVLTTVKAKLEALISSITVGACRPIALALLTGLQERFQKILQLKGDTTVLAAAFHPFLKLRWIPKGIALEKKKKKKDHRPVAASCRARAAGNAHGQ
ncbi:hypothetical protein, partial [Bradyrhizobium sp. 33ap4]|uniref:hypothetical protein n=1 Tax=Bradyrhizobium sp. 33ap4 TaxID=3061630 RepID=UPI00292F6C8F